jgi:hypothetical protein
LRNKIISVACDRAPFEQESQQRFIHRPRKPNLSVVVVRDSRFSPRQEIGEVVERPCVPAEHGWILLPDLIGDDTDVPSVATVNKRDRKRSLSFRVASEVEVVHRSKWGAFTAVHDVIGAEIIRDRYIQDVREGLAVA